MHEHGTNLVISARSASHWCRHASIEILDGDRLRFRADLDVLVKVLVVLVGLIGPKASIPLPTTDGQKLVAVHAGWKAEPALVGKAVRRLHDAFRVRPLVVVVQAVLFRIQLPYCGPHLRTLGWAALPVFFRAYKPGFRHDLS